MKRIRRPPGVTILAMIIAVGGLWFVFSDDPLGIVFTVIGVLWVLFDVNDGTWVPFDRHPEK